MKKETCFKKEFYFNILFIKNCCIEKYPNVNWPEAIKPLVKKI